MTTLFKNETFTDLLEAGRKVEIAVSSGSSALFKRLRGDDLIDSVSIASGVTRIFGEYFVDQNYRVDCLSGTVTITESQSTESVKPFNVDDQGAVTGITAPDGTSINLAATKTFSELQTAVSNGFVGTAFVSDVGNGSIWVSDGTRARPLNGEVVVYNQQATVNFAATTPRTIGIEVGLPVGLLHDNDVLEVSVDISKSGTVDASTTQLQVGNTAVVGTQVGNSAMTMSSGGNRRFFGTFRIKRLNATTIILLNGPNGQDGSAASSDLAATTSTILSLDSAIRYLQLTNAMSAGGSDVVTVNKMIVKLVTG